MADAPETTSARRTHRALDVSFVVTLLSMAIAAATIILFVTRTKEWAPLGPYPEQVILSDTSTRWAEGTGVEGNPTVIPSASLKDGTVSVKGTKCSDQTVLVDGRLQWTALDPRGPSWTAGAGIGTRDEGCATLTFANQIPADVAEWAADQLAAGVTPVVRIGGCETPVDPEKGREGVVACWQTEPFALVE